MLRMQWNALRTGDHVLVHEAAGREMRLVPGVVALVETTPGSNEIAIRLTSHGPSRLVRPQRLAVHLDPIEPGRSCWRCASLH